jgi:hypothetical protein
MGRRFVSEADLNARESKNWRGRVCIGRCGLLVLLALLAFSAGPPAMADPLDLQDPTPRRIEVRFEVSPENEPGRLDAAWSSPRVAFVESDPGHSLVRIRIPTEEIEAHLRATGTEAISGSFSDFVWTLDSHTGHVLSAELTGRVRERVSLGPIRTSATVDIRVDMTTRDTFGFRPPKRIFGVQTNALCRPSQQPSPPSPPSPSSGCVAVAPIRFDPESGYVNAVGSLVAAAPIAKIRTFSPLGEVRFSERGPIGTETVVSGTSQEDAVCLEGFNGPCWPDLGGES